MSGPYYMPDRLGLALVGYRGTGKTTVGYALADVLGRRFVDADREVEAWQGRSIRAIFEEDGEPAFRDLEERVIGQLTARPARVVLATGGGAVLRASNREALRRFGFVVTPRSPPSWPRGNRSTARWPTPRSTRSARSRSRLSRKSSKN
jgi:shikimate kinase